MITPAHAFFNWAILRKWFRPWWVVAGSVLPDVPPFVAFFYLLAQKGINQGSMGGFFGFVMANGNPNRQPGFMEISFLLNALPLYALAGTIVLISFFPEWSPRGLVSYWDPRYGAETFNLVQLAAAVLILAWLVGERLWKTRKTPQDHEEKPDSS